MVFFSFWGEPVSFFFVEYFGMSVVLLQYLFGGSDGGTPFGPCFWPRHRNLPLLPIDLWVEGS